MSIYSMGMERGEVNGYMNGVLIAMKRFGKISVENEERVRSETDISKLKTWLEKATLSENLAEFEKALWG